MATVQAPGTALRPEIRHCRGLDELEACVRLQQEVWNFSDLDLIPLRLFVVAEKIGGQVIGAFDGPTLVGFALSLPGERAGHAFLHSHMLAVRETHRNAGLGRSIKLFQCDDALSRGFDLIEWTFDPLEIKNAHLNIARLGAIARRYNLNQYGMSSSPLQGGLPTDRLVAEWWLRSNRVKALLEGGALPQYQTELTVRVPAEIYAWKASETDRPKAKDVQSANREAFLRAFRAGLAILAHEVDSAGKGLFHLGRWDENWSYATGGAHEG